MPLLKRKPVIPNPLPSLSAVLQPLPSTSANAGDPSSSSSGPSETPLPNDGKDDEEQLDKLLSVFRGEMHGVSKDNNASSTGGKGKKAQSKLTNGKHPNEGDVSINGDQPNGIENKAIWKSTDKECWYLPETGEIFTDYESFCARRAFYAQPLFQCEVSGKSSLSFYAALQSEQKEVRQLHSRFPRQLKKAVLSSVQFQIEGKLDTLADKIFERFHDRFFDQEKVFVDVDGDKYLARIVKTFPPRSLATTSSPAHPTKPILHPYATDLSLPLEEVNEKDDPSKYFYNVRLIEEGYPEGIAAEYASANGQSNGPYDEEEEDGKGEKWMGSTMEVQCDKISRDRINFSRAMLKRFIRDCVVRDAAVYSPWLVKPSVAGRYGIPTEMTDEIRQGIQRYKEKQMDKRKREREERLGITHEEEEEKPKTKKQKKDEERKMKEEDRLRDKEAREREKEKEREEEERRKKKALKYPAEDLLVEWSDEKDVAAGRIQVRPAPNKTLPFGDQFEKLLTTWSFLNVMGKPLGLSPFTLDEFEQSLYHADPTTLLTEIHAVLLNALSADLAAGHEAVKPLSNYGKEGEPDNDTDYWEGRKGATTETLAPVVAPLAENWKTKELSIKDSRKGWESSLIGCLWEKGTLEILPNYLDNILHLTFEDKPAPTRPTWSTAPKNASSGGIAGLIPSKPEKRYPTLHHSHKLDIINFLIELVGQTEILREFMEESTLNLTEVRKDQVEVKRELRRVQAEKEALEPKEKPKEEGEEGDISMMTDSADISMNGHPNGNGNGHIGNGSSGLDRDELEDSASIQDDNLSDVESDHNISATGASRRKAMKEKALEREAEENLRNQKLAKEREELRIRKIEGKQIAAEKKRLMDEEEVINTKLRHLEYDFRRWIYTLRSRPLGYDRFGNKVWWMDGLGSSPILLDGKVVVGTGRIYLQGVDPEDEEILRNLASAVVEDEVVLPEYVEERRRQEEGQYDRLEPGEWAVYETVDEVKQFMNWLCPRGIRENQLLKQFRMWDPEIEQGIKKRRALAGLDKESIPDSDEPRRTRPTRKVNQDEEKEGFLNWKNKRASASA
ncbi:uncharacterized protein I303_101865 [Kwoniella dejecticola CBS 10117]|uniref:DDT domain-containing protein n=1 Tax=Kwoniella dejecticola CBS 10117 TaxID=1296121 RepID=A0A1A6ACK2_9TREE|nr:uncharacterized protein I303_01999 [Kwoniella dejecticola CBS 10117]OBR87786.1 hypothetical protein I303_01999 [Kwoniella dejecticola CBS 10117]